MTEDLFGCKQKPREREVTLNLVTSDQHLGCDYCGWQIKAGEWLNVVVLDDEVRFFCNDHERCVRQAGK
jgi:hypothetical protein